MAAEPRVCAIMLTRDRPAMAARAVRSFRAQTYGNKHLLIYDSSPKREVLREEDCYDSAGHTVVFEERQDLSIGVLRNHANKMIGWRVKDGEVIIHWDDDDYSHPNRIAEQVALLQSSGADAVGYREMLFWRTGKVLRQPDDGNRNAEAWLYSNPSPTYALGASLCYWRRTWEARPFADKSQGVEEEWCREMKVRGIPAFNFCFIGDEDKSPRMIASIHGGNTSAGYNIEEYVRLGSTQWRRAPKWDEYCRERMAL